MASIDDLMAWFERDIGSGAWAENVRVDEPTPGIYEVHFFTDTNEYLLTITCDSMAESRVDCVVRARKARAGLANPRTRPLLRPSNRRLSERIWLRIVCAIVGMELVRVHRRETIQAPKELAAAPGAIVA